MKVRSQLRLLPRGMAALALVVSATACARQDSRTANAETMPAGAVPLAAHAVRAVDMPENADSLTVTVYKSPTCGCCTAWVDHMRENGFTVTAIDVQDVEPIKRRHGVRQEHYSCHTSIVGPYVIEGHVPAADVRRLLAERPQITGIAVPGMPQGSPGMETGIKDRYNVIAFTPHGTPTIFARH